MLNRDWLTVADLPLADFDSEADAAGDEWKGAAIAFEKEELAGMRDRRVQVTQSQKMSHRMVIWTGFCASLLITLSFVLRDSWIGIAALTSAGTLAAMALNASLRLALPAPLPMGSQPTRR